MKKLMNAAAGTLLAVIATASAGCAEYGAVVEMSGTVYMADGVTSLPANSELEIVVNFTAYEDSFEDDVQYSQPFTTDPFGGYLTAVEFSGMWDGKLMAVQARARGQLGITIQSLLVAYSGDFRAALEKQITASCILFFESRNYSLGTLNLEKRGTRTVGIEQDFVVNVTADQLVEYENCQKRIFELFAQTVSPSPATESLN